MAILAHLKNKIIFILFFIYFYHGGYMQQLFIYLDESEKNGVQCSWFFGGMLVEAGDHKQVVERLRRPKRV